jgi:hypothetical protein
MKCLFRGLLTLSMVMTAGLCRADTFGGGADSFDIEFVTVGQPGNPTDTTGIPNPAGAVPYEYRIGKYEISEQMIDKANALGGLGINKDTRGPDKPASSVSWFEAAKFVNWLNTSTLSVPAYKFDAEGNFQLWEPADPGYDPTNLYRNKLARYFLPSADEWYKAAFYDPSTGVYWDYPTGSDVAPISVAFGTAPGTAVWNQPFEQGPAEVYLSGGASPYGTVGQGGNVWEWEESESNLVNDTPAAQRGLRGGDWIPSLSALGMSSTFRNRFLPENNPINVGFRVASIPEPGALWLVTFGASTLLLFRNIVHKHRLLRHRLPQSTTSACRAAEWSGSGRPTVVT